MSFSTFDLTGSSNVIELNRNKVFNALNFNLKNKQSRTVMSFYTETGCGFFNSVKDYTSQHNIYCISIDMGFSSLANHIAMTPNGRFFVAADAKWLHELNSRGGVIILDAIDTAFEENRNIIKHIILTTINNGDSPFTPNVQVIVTYKNFHSIEAGILKNTAEYSLES